MPPFTPTPHPPVRAGEELVPDPSTGVQYKVSWEQDESGNLVVSDCRVAGGSRCMNHP